MPKHYTQKYRTEWEKLEELKGWLLPVTTDVTSAKCKYCKCTVAARLYDLKKHEKNNSATLFMQ